MTKLSSFYINGTAVDHEWLLANQERLQDATRDDMRQKGFIPAIDVPVTLKWEYDHKKGVCKFKGTAKGLKVGRKRSLASPDIGYLSGEGIIVTNGATEARVLV